MRYVICNRSHQRGAALLVMMMIFIIAASYALVTKLNANTREYLRRGSSLSVLNQAKAALIGYAVNYPLDHAGKGPGRLPCPDTTDNGSAVPNCSGATTGRFPFKTQGLETEDFRDHSGERLWYRVANNYRSYTVGGPKVNSELTGDFTVDSTSNIVAVIFAPGAPVGTQDRANDPLDVVNYLEDENADTNDIFTTQATGDFNDTLVTITRQELMSVVEKRVLGDVAEKLTDYQNNYGAYPWLSSFSDPSTSSFRGTVSTGRGHLPLHWSIDPDSIQQGGTVTGRNPFTTDLNISWNTMANADETQSVSESVSTTHGYSFVFPAPTLSCLRNNACADTSDPFYNQLPANLTISGASCTWTDKNTFNCTGSYSISKIQNYDIWNNDGTTDLQCTNQDAGTGYGLIGANFGSGSEWKTVYRDSATTGIGYHKYRERMTGTLTRTYDFSIDFVDPEGIGTATSPTSTTIRTRDLDISGNLSSATINITVTDVLTGVTFDTPYSYSTPSFSAKISNLTSDADTTGNIVSTGIQYDLDIDDGEFPSWFVENGWHELIYISYASGESLPGDTTAGQDCISLSTTCITVNIDGTVNNNVRAAVFSAGAELSVQDRSSSPDETDYFEYENSSPVDDLFVKNKITTSYNDHTRIISTAP
ncbi:MAG: hypothetical protein O7D86_07420 [Proteobacteria bacterium]|nr:hypothetical protein [Pseudomonadota bacterium]